jgi:hypothetical protein
MNSQLNLSKKGLSWPVWVVILCVVMLLVMVCFCFFKKNGGNKKVVQQKMALTENQSYIEKTFSWLEEQKNDQGLYFLGINCDRQNRECIQNSVIRGENEDGLVVAWARFKNYQKNKNPKDLEIITQDLATYFSRYEKGNISGLWTCKMMYEMWQSDYFNNGIKANMEKICQDNNYLGLDKITNDYNSGINEHLFDGYSASTSDFVTKYLWNKDENDLKLAKDYLEKSKINYEFNMMQSPNEVCLLGISALDLYQVDKDNKDMELSQNIYNVDVGADNPIRRARYLTPICNLFLGKMHEVTGEQKYLDIVEDNNKKIINDYSSNDGKGFFQITYNADKTLYSKNVVENAILLVSLLI